MGVQVMVIVEGHGESESIRIVLERTWYELLGGNYIEVLKPWRQPQGTLLKEDGLKNHINQAKIKLDHAPPLESTKLLLLLIDSEGQCPKSLAPRLLQWAREARADADLVCVLPHPMFETWFAAAAASLAGVNGLPDDVQPPDAPEENNIGKGWLRKQLGRKYKETIDQARYAAQMDLTLCRQNSSSFDKLCRELEKRLPTFENTSNTEED